MATQVGMGLSKVILLVGAGFTGSIMLRNGKLYDILAELQTLVKGMEKSGEDSGADSDYSNALAAQDGAKPTGRRGFLGSAETRSLKGLQHIAESIESGNFDKSKTEAIFQDDINSLDNTKTLSRAASVKCSHECTVEGNIMARLLTHRNQE